MVTTVQGSYAGSGKKIAIVASRFNDFIVQSLIQGAVDCLERHGTKPGDITLLRVPGAFEIAPVAARLADGKAFDGIICLGAVIRGSTPHFDYVAGESAKGVSKISMSAGMPIIYGVITTDSIEQAIERAGTKSGNKGADAALACLEMMDLYRQADALS